MVVVSLIIPIYLMIFLGWYLKSTGRYGPDAHKTFSFITYYILMPISIASEIASAEMRLEKGALHFFLIVILQMIVFYFLWTRLDKERGFEAFANSVRGNVIYLGFPIMNMLLPEETLPLGILMASIFSSLTLFIIQLFYSSGKKKLDWRSLLANPLILALLTGIFLNFTGLWHPMMSKIASQLTRPMMFMALVTIGSSFDLESLKKTKVNLRLFLTVFTKLIVQPVSFFLIARLINLAPECIGIGLILLAAPPAVSNYVVLEELGEATDLSSNAVIFSTATYLLSLPLIAYLVELNF